MIHANTNHASEIPAATFPPGLDMRWETVQCLGWNTQEQATEEQELVYEISWIPELGAWRRFLRSRRKVMN